MLFNPIEKSYIWGKETWLLYDHGDMSSTNNPTDEQLHKMWNDHRAYLFGENAPDLKRFPLKIKIIDADQNLSIQVHPQEMEEYWLCLEKWRCIGKPESACAIGLITSMENLFLGNKQTLDFEVLEKNLIKRRPSPHESMYVPGGIMHYIGGKHKMLEVSSFDDSIDPTSSTYRIYDWSRGRLLDIEGAARHAIKSQFSKDFLPLNRSAFQAKRFCVKTFEAAANEVLFFKSGKSFYFVINLETLKNAFIPASLEHSSYVTVQDGGRYAAIAWNESDFREIKKMQAALIPGEEVCADYPKRSPLLKNNVDIQ